jgi:hypothetical protein
VPQPGGKAPQDSNQPQQAVVQIVAETRVTVIPRPHPKFVLHRAFPPDPMVDRCAFAVRPANKSFASHHKVSL